VETTIIEDEIFLRVKENVLPEEVKVGERSSGAPEMAPAPKSQGLFEAYAAGRPSFINGNRQRVTSKQYWSHRRFSFLKSTVWISISINA
jgi:hypothetical protein